VVPDPFHERLPNGPEHPVDGLFERGLGGHASPPPLDAWSRLAAQLDAEAALSGSVSSATQRADGRWSAGFARAGQWGMAAALCAGMLFWSFPTQPTQEAWSNGQTLANLAMAVDGSSGSLPRPEQVLPETAAAGLSLPAGAGLSTAEAPAQIVWKEHSHTAERKAQRAGSSAAPGSPGSGQVVTSQGATALLAVAPPALTPSSEAASAAAPLPPGPAATAPASSEPPARAAAAALGTNRMLGGAALQSAAEGETPSQSARLNTAEAAVPPAAPDGTEQPQQASFSSRGQAKFFDVSRLYGGLHLNVQYTSLLTRGGSQPDDNLDAMLSIGQAYGATLGYAFSDRVALETGLVLDSRQGSRYQSTLVNRKDEALPVTKVIMLHYTQVPLTIRVRSHAQASPDRLSWHYVGGLQYGMLRNSRLRLDDRHVSPDRDLQQHEIAVLLGMDCDIPLANRMFLSLGLRSSLGLNPAGINTVEGINRDKHNAVLGFRAAFNGFLVSN
jgi:hypothetical protein